MPLGEGRGKRGTPKKTLFSRCWLVWRENGCN